MGDDLSRVKSSALDIVNGLFADLPNSRVSVADYRDFPQSPYGGSGDYPYRAALPFSDNLTDITGAIDSLSIGWGNDYPESAYSALMNTIQGKGIGGWREAAKKSIILFTDAPPHEPEPFTGYTASSVIAAAQNPLTIQTNPTGFSRNAATDSVISGLSTSLASKTDATTNPVSIYSVVLGGNPSAVNYFSQISQETGGQLYTSPDILESFLAALEDIKEDVTEPEPDPEPQSVPEPTSLLGLLLLSIGGACQKLKKITRAN